MSGHIQSVLEYSRAGGPLLLAIAAASYMIWFYYLTSRKRIARTANVFGAVCRAVAPGGGETVAQGLELAGPDDRGSECAIRMAAVEALTSADSGGAFDAFARKHLDGISRDIMILAALTAAAPLLGLLGTVMGMIQTFSGVAGVGGETYASISSGISKALITTQYGLLAAIPGVFGAARLKRMVGSLRTDIGYIKARMLAAKDALA